LIATPATAAPSIVIDDHHATQIGRERTAGDIGTCHLMTWNVNSEMRPTEEMGLITIAAEIDIVTLIHLMSHIVTVDHGIIMTEDVKTHTATVDTTDLAMIQWTIDWTDGGMIGRTGIHPPAVHIIGSLSPQHGEHSDDFL